MADATITAASVVSGAGAKRRIGTSGATITAGKAVYLDSVSGTYKLSRGNADFSALIDGIALNSASSGQPVHVQYEGEIYTGGGLFSGHLYVVSVATAGNIRPTEDLANDTGDEYASFVGVALDSDTLELHLFNSPAVWE